MYRLLFLALLLSGNLAGVVCQTTSKNTESNQSTGNSRLTVTSSPENITAQDFYKEGLRLTDEGQLLQAVQELQQAVRLDPEYAEAHAALGRAYFKLRQWQNAADSLHRASALKSRPRVVQSSQTNDKLDPKKSENAPKTPKPIQPRSDQSEAKTAASQGASNGANHTNISAQPNTTFVAAKTLAQPKPVIDETKSQTASAIPASPPNQNTASDHATVDVAQASGPTTNLRTKTNPKEDILAQDREVQSPRVAPDSAKTSENVTLPPATESASKAKKDSFAPLTSSETTVAPNPVKQPAVFRPPLDMTRLSGTAEDVPVESPSETAGVRVAMSVPPTAMPLETKPVTPIATKTANDELSLMKIYRIGPGDVLDVQIDDSEPTRSTLFTVNSEGLLEHPLLAESVLVTGFTTEEISARVAAGLAKNSSGQSPKVIVGVRDYASHSILVSGLVKDSGTKFLRREAIPLYVVVADAQPLPEAARVTVLRNEVGQIFDIDLTQAAEMNMMVHPGDVITLQPNVTQFYYIAGEVKFPGEKTFRRGLTLTQAILTAGGATGKSKLAQIARDDGQGFLIDTTVELNEIQSGKIVDPILKPGDRVTILR